MLIITSPTQEAEAKYNDTVYPSDFIEAWSYWEDNANSSKVCDWYDYSVYISSPPPEHTLTAYGSIQNCLLNDANELTLYYTQTSTADTVNLYFIFRFDLPYQADKLYYDVRRGGGGDGNEVLTLYVNEDGVDTSQDTATNGDITGNFAITSSMIQNGQIHGMLQLQTSGSVGWTDVLMGIDMLAISFDDTNNPNLDYRSLQLGMTQDSVDGTFKQENSINYVKDTDNFYFETKRYSGIYGALDSEDANSQILVELILKAGVKGTLSVEARIDSEEDTTTDQTLTRSYDKTNVDADGNLYILISGMVAYGSGNNTHSLAIFLWDFEDEAWWSSSSDYYTNTATNDVDQWVSLKIDQIKATVTQWTDNVILNFHNPFGVGLPFETAQVYVDDERQSASGFFMPNDSFNLTITDYFGHTIYQDTTETTADFIDVELPLYEVFVMNKDDDQNFALWISDTGSDSDIDFRVKLPENFGFPIYLYSQTYYFKVVEGDITIVEWTLFTVTTGDNNPLVFGENNPPVVVQSGGGGPDLTYLWIGLILMGMVIAMGIIVRSVKDSQPKKKYPGYPPQNEAYPGKKGYKGY